MREYLVQPQLSVQADLSPAAWLHTAQQNQRSRHQSPGKTLVTPQRLQTDIAYKSAATLKRLQTRNIALGNATEAKELLGRCWGLFLRYVEGAL